VWDACPEFSIDLSCRVERHREIVVALSGFGMGEWREGSRGRKQGGTCRNCCSTEIRSKTLDGIWPVESYDYYLTMCNTEEVGEGYRAGSSTAVVFAAKLGAEHCRE